MQRDRIKCNLKVNNNMKNMNLMIYLPLKIMVLMLSFPIQKSSLIAKKNKIRPEYLVFLMFNPCGKTKKSTKKYKTTDENSFKSCKVKYRLKNRVFQA